MATAVRVRFPPSAPARHQGLWQLAATLSFFVVSSSKQAQTIPCFSCLHEFGSNRWYKRCLKCHPLPLLPLTRTALSTPTQQPVVPASIFYFRCALPAAAKKRLGNVEIRLSLGTCFRQEAKLLACRLFALLHASLPGVPDLPTLRHILIRHLSSMQGKKGREYGDFQGRLPLCPHGK
ncbi:DUF6538 domain-containing protein [Desulfovibrio piger]|uniref:DUF6538 domain-containing protein n=1 Tax=Desulfovibrio piger TaxID=901 RepID=UPI0039F563C6